MTKLEQLKGKIGYRLLIDGVDVRPDICYNKYQFAAIGQNANGERFNKAEELGLEKQSNGDYIVTDLKKFDDFIATPPSKGPFSIWGSGETGEVINYV